MRLYSNFLIPLLSLTFFAGNAQQVKIVSSFPQNNAAYGYSVSQDDNYLIVGAKDETVNNVKSGAAYIYHLENDTWIEQARLFPDEAHDGEYFGISVSIVGDYAAIGASGNDTNGTNSGAVFIYKRDRSNWALHQKLTPSSLGTFDEFGVSVAVSKDVLIIGAYSDDTNGLFAGAAYIYELENDVWKEKAKLLPDDVKREDKFGRSVATDGKKVIIGSVLSDEQGTDSGSAYIISRNESGVWEQEVKLLAPDGESNDRFGRSVGIANEIVAVGAVLDNDHGNNSGSVYVFRNYSDGWDLQSKVVASDGKAEDFFGYSLSLTASYLLVGALNADVAATKSGAAYLFGQTGPNWVQLDKLSANVGTSLDNFGEAVHIDETWICIGAPYQNTSTGAVYIEPAPIPLALNEIENKSIYFYPNPASEILTINLSSAVSERTVILYDAKGKEWLRQAIKPNQIQLEIDVQHLNKGLYFMLISSPTGVIREKVIIN